MNISTIGGLILAWGCLITSVVMEGGELHSFMKAGPAILVIGGTIGATLIGFSMEEILAVPAALKASFSKKEYNYQDLIKMLIEFAKKSRRDGILALENSVDALEDKFLKKSLQMLVDGVDLERLQETMENDLNTLKQWYKEGSEFMKQMGGFSPTLGIVGTVLGLIMMLSKLEDPANMGPAIASAFIATMYGISTANLIYLPLANKITNVGAKELLEKRIMLEGVLCISSGISPRNAEEMLKAYIPINEQNRKPTESEKK